MSNDQGGVSAMSAELGDTVACDVKMPRPETIAMRLDTPEAVKHANKLLAGNWGWRILKKGEHKDMCPHEDGSPYYMPPNTEAMRHAQTKD